MDPAEVTPSHLPPGPVHAGDGMAAVAEREEVGHPCVDSCGSLISFRQSSAAAQQPGCSSTGPGNQPQPTCCAQSDQDDARDADGFVHVLNGFTDGGQLSGRLTSCPALGPTPMLETG